MGFTSSFFGISSVFGFSSGFGSKFEVVSCEPCGKTISSGSSYFIGVYGTVTLGKLAGTATFVSSFESFDSLESSTFLVSSFGVDTAAGFDSSS